MFIIMYHKSFAGNALPLIFGNTCTAVTLTYFIYFILSLSLLMFLAATRSR